MLTISIARGTKKGDPIEIKRYGAVLMFCLPLFGALGCSGSTGANVLAPRQEDSGVDATAADASLDRTAEGADANDDVFETGADAREEGGEAASPSDAGVDSGGDATADATTEAVADAVADADAGTDAVAEGGCGIATGDPRNCGVCGHDCTALPHVSGPVACAAFGQCAFSLSSCAPGWTHCSANPDQGCETNISQASNCGVCGNNCPNSAPVCSGSVNTYSCVTGCSGSTPTLCGGACVNTATDPANCGSCAHACPGVTGGRPTCPSGICAIQCNTGYTNCSGACVDETSDDNNCNACGNKCLGGKHCVTGSCQCTSGPPVWLPPPLWTPPAPNWTALLDDPRWATGTIQYFYNQTGGTYADRNDAVYRVVDAPKSLSVSIQARIDPNGIDGRDVVYFGITQPGTSLAHLFAIQPDNGTPPVTDPTGLVPHDPVFPRPNSNATITYFRTLNTGLTTQWCEIYPFSIPATGAGPCPAAFSAPPPWLQNVASWTNSPALTAGGWAVTFQIDTSALGAIGQSVQMVFGTSIELSGGPPYSIMNLTTTFQTGTLIGSTPVTAGTAQWTSFGPLGNSCP